MPPKRTMDFFQTETNNANKSPQKKKKAVDKSNESTTEQMDTSKASDEKNVFRPGATDFDPVKSATWTKDSGGVPFAAFAQTLQSLEDVSKRTEIVRHVTNFFRSVIEISPDELIPSLYLFMNKVAPDYEGIELGIGESVLVRSIAEVTGRSVDSIKADLKRKGDLGLVAESSRSNQRVMFAPKPLTIKHVFKTLKEIATLSGKDSNQKRLKLIKCMFVACKGAEARYFIRGLQGTLRVGLGELSLLSALAHACVMQFHKEDYDKASVEKSKRMLDVGANLVKAAFAECSSFDKLVEALIATRDLNKLPELCKPTPGIPLKPMLAHPTRSIEDILKRFEDGEFVCEYKYDGERAQIHIVSPSEVRLFSRNSEDTTPKYADVAEFVLTAIDEKKGVQNAIIDSEIVAYDRKDRRILPFQVLSHRKRKNGNFGVIYGPCRIGGLILPSFDYVHRMTLRDAIHFKNLVADDEKIDVCVFAFDLLYLNGQSLINRTLPERRSLLRKHFKIVDGQFDFVTDTVLKGDTDKLQEFLDKSVEDGTEGLIVKLASGNSTYETSKRSLSWLKLKKDYLDKVGDSLDLVVIGAYQGTGKRTGNYGGFLLACYDADDDEYQTICKIGTGFSDEDLKFFNSSLDKIKADTKPRNYRSQLTPDVWFNPREVWEVKCADLSISPVHMAAIGLVSENKGISLRFPRFVRRRTDKWATQATNSTQVAELYSSQQKEKENPYKGLNYD